jgi:hypothetical protein
MASGTHASLTFTNYTTANGLGNDDVFGVFESGGAARGAGATAEHREEGERSGLRWTVRDAAGCRLGARLEEVRSTPRDPSLHGVSDPGVRSPGSNVPRSGPVFPSLAFQDFDGDRRS